LCTLSLATQSFFCGKWIRKTVAPKTYFMIETIQRLLEMPLKDDSENECTVIVKNEEVHENDVLLGRVSPNACVEFLLFVLCIGLTLMGIC